MGRGKAHGLAQQAIVRKALKKGVSPREILAKYPDREFALGGLKKLAEKCEKTEALGRKAGTGPKKKRTARQATEAKKALEKNPDASQRCLAKGLGAPQTTLRRIMKEDLEMETYRTAKAQKLKVGSKRQRLEAREAWRQQMEAVQLRRKNIFFDDEKTFLLARAQRRARRTTAFASASPPRSAISR